MLALSAYLRLQGEARCERKETAQRLHRLQVLLVSPAFEDMVDSVAQFAQSIARIAIVWPRGAAKGEHDVAWARQLIG